MFRRLKTFSVFQVLISFRLLFHNGYLRISRYDNKTQLFTVELPNLELENDLAMRFNASVTGSDESTYRHLIDVAGENLDKRQWSSFIDRLDAFNKHISYNLMTNQKTGLEAWFQFTTFLILDLSNRKHRHKLLLMEDVTSKGQADIVHSFGNEVLIFEPKMVTNPENPVYDCKEKYIWKHLFGPNENVTCIGLKFNRSGIVESWGVAVYSKQGKLIEEDGNKLLTTQFNPQNRKLSALIKKYFFVFIIFSN